jgi:hypothetical protein
LNSNPSEVGSNILLLPKEETCPEDATHPYLPKLAAWKMAREWREYQYFFVKNIDSITSNRKAAKLTDVCNSSKKIRIDRVISSALAMSLE